MTGRAVERVRGYVLAYRDYGESDRIVTVLTGEKGKFKGIAKGARRSRKRFANAIELFCLSSILVSRRRPEGLYLIEECDVINHYPAIREDLEKTLAASYFSELVDLFTAEEKPGPRLFDHLKGFLDLLEHGPLSESLSRFFELRLLSLSGYEPALDRCAGCGSPLGGTRGLSFVPEEGRSRCEGCCGPESSGVHLSPGTIQTLIAGNTIALDKIRRLSFTGRALRESDAMMSRLIRHILGREPRSMRVCKEVLLLARRKESSPS
ncbi:MAG: DNA repair protein RecO [Syntrophales bacterium]|jgi:DNA repair protein RecO (recombination protein O)|nr:DNA repair protein RecO [Syntrophales bacterium]MCK9527133.1 DNA repair protein RecO [Syntrophales bacterium]MDX9921742.1 DNA repair protein RecO [Syntrophales bacterium]